MRSSDRIVPEVMRTAPMPERAKKTHKLMEHPILGHTSQMWEFFLQELKDIADVADLFPETRTAVELALALRQDSISMLGRDETVDAKISASLLTALYFINIRPGTEISESSYGDILADISRIRAIIHGVHGASPGLRLVEKTDYYGWLVMFMLANAVNKAFSEMSEKSWIESNILLDSALRLCRNIYGYVFKDVIIFINGGELGGATTASWHAHLLERLNENYIKSLPKSGENNLITQDDFARLRRRQLDGQLIKDFLCDVATENFLHLGASLPKSDLPAAHVPFIARIRHLAEELANPAIDSDFGTILSKLTKSDIRNPCASTPPYISVLDFLKTSASDYLYPSSTTSTDAHKKSGDLGLRERKRLFCRHVGTYRRKINYWDRYSKRVTLSPATEILSGALLTRLQGLKSRIDGLIADSRTIPENIDIKVEVICEIRSLAGDLTVPQIRFTAPPDLWSLYGKDVFAVAEQALNDWWGQVFDLAVQYLTLVKASDTSPERLQEIIGKLNERFGLSDYFSMLKWRNIPFELQPGALDYGAGRHARFDDIPQAVQNYLTYFLACFARSAKHSKKSGLHKRSLCPRTTTIKLVQRDGRELRETIIQPMPAYKPLMPVPSFNALLGPIELLAEANARFEIVEMGKSKWVVQKMGGEDVLFQRDKRKHHYGISYLRQQGERDFISGINYVIKTKIMDEAYLGPIDDLYRLHYVREHCTNVGADFRTVVAALSDPQPTDLATQALAHADREMDKVRRRYQDKEHGFHHYKRIELVLRSLRAEKGFNDRLDASGLPENKILRDHITQILAIRELERAQDVARGLDEPVDDTTAQAREALLQDNLDTTIFFRLAESMVSHAFARVAATRETKPHASHRKQKDVLRDTRNSTFLLADTIARLLYRYVASHEQKAEFRSGICRGSLDPAFLTSMIDYVVKGLSYSGYKTREFWELEGAPETEGYVELLSERQLPADIIEGIVRRYQEYRNAIGTVSDLLGRRLLPS